MIRRLRVVFAVGLILAASSVGALEKTAVRVTDVERGDWGAASTISVVYYNFCTGWMWVWAGWSPNDVIGVCYTNPYRPPGDTVVSTTWELVYTTAPAGYGFTGIIDVWEGDSNCCAVGHMAGQPFYFYGTWNGHGWGIPAPEIFLVTVTFGPVPGIPSGMASDHPAAGPTGPPACGYCYPTPRTCHSYYYGTVTSPYCPGVTLSDGTCCVEWIWDAAVSGPCNVTESSWGNIKALYR